MPTTDVILTEKIASLGAEADVVKVKRGYARNFLIPQGKALEVTPATLRRLNQLKSKRADEDDMRVIEKGSTNLEVGGDNDRFETELPLLERSGKRIGALGLVFSLKPGADKEALHRHGLAIRDELARAIPNNAALFNRAR